MKVIPFANTVATFAFSQIITLSVATIPHLDRPAPMPFFRTYNNEADISKESVQKQERIYGRVVKVIDGDTFRIRHYPLYPFIRCNSYDGKLSDNTIRVRIYGVDAPEIGYFGMKSMPYAKEARDFTKKLVDRKIVKVKLLRKDQYGRVVGVATTRSIIPFFPGKDISLTLSKAGYATLYTGGGCEYDGRRTQLEKNIQYAKKKRKGIWKNGPVGVVLPSEYKRQVKKVNGK